MANIQPTLKYGMKSGLITKSAVSESEYPKDACLECINLNFDTVGKINSRNGSEMLGQSLNNAGVELVTNGSFTGNADGWDLGSEEPPSGWLYNNNNVIHDGTDEKTTEMFQSPFGENGGSYSVSINVGGTTGSISIMLGDSDPNPYQIQAAAGDVSFVHTMSFDSDSGIAIFPSADFDGTIDNVSVIRVNYTSKVNLYKMGIGTLTDYEYGQNIIYNGSFLGNANGWGFLGDDFSYNENNIIFNYTSGSSSFYTMDYDESGTLPYIIGGKSYLIEFDYTGDISGVSVSLNYSDTGHSVEISASGGKATGIYTFDDVSDGYVVLEFSSDNGTFDGGIIDNVSMKMILVYNSLLASYGGSVYYLEE